MKTAATQLPDPLSHWDIDDEDFPVSDWVDEVRNNDTRLGYLEWLEHRRETAADDANDDDPLTPDFRQKFDTFRTTPIGPVRFGILPTHVCESGNGTYTGGFTRDEVETLIQCDLIGPEQNNGYNVYSWPIKSA